MSNNSLKNRILSISPIVELIIRFIYWKLLKKYINKTWINNFKSDKKITKKQINFDLIINELKSLNILPGSILILHSSFEQIANAKLSPNEVIDKFLNYLGNEGTLAMNAARILNKSPHDNVLTYDINKSRVWTGVLPSMMIKRKNAEISKYPFNSMVAIGHHAKAMMKNNLNGEFLSSCGKNSSWNYCFENDAYILGLGIDLTHSLTMIHVAEESFFETWPQQDWFEEKKLRIIDNEFENIISVYERKEKWGKLHFAERTLCEDLVRDNILTIKEIEGVSIEVINSTKLINYLREKNKNGYPYFFIN